MVCCFLAARDSRERPRVGCDGFRDGPAIDELPFAVAGDQPGFAQNLEMVRDSCGGHVSHRDDLATVHVFGCRDGLKDPEPGLVGQGFRYLLNLRTVHGPIHSVANSSLLPPERTLSFRKEFQKTCNQVLRCSSKSLNLAGAGSGRMDTPGEGQAENSPTIGRLT